METLYASGTQTATVTTEHFLSSPNVAGKFLLILDLVNMAANDVLEVYGYKMAIAGGTSRICYFRQFYGAQPTDALVFISDYIDNTLTDTNAVRWSIKQTFGTGRSFPWAVLNAEDWTSTATPPPINLTQILGTTLTETVGGYLTAAFKKFFDIAVPVFTTAAINQTGDSYTRLGAPAGASVSADIAAIRTDTNTTLPALIAALNNLSAAQVNAEVVDCLNVDTYAQPGQGTPAATTTIRLMLAYVYKSWRNRRTQTATEFDLFNDDAVTVDQKAAFSDNGTTADRGEIATGP